MRIHRLALWASALTALGTMSVSGNSSASSHREAPAISGDPDADNTDLWAWVKPTTHDFLYVAAAYIPLEEPDGAPNWHRFSDEVLYEVHITRGDSLADAYTYQIRFSSTAYASGDPNGLDGTTFFSQVDGKKQTYSVTQIDWTGATPKSTVIATAIPVAPVNIGPRTDAYAYGLGGGVKPNSAANDATLAAAYSAAVDAAPYVGTLTGGGRTWAGPRDDGFWVDLGSIFDLASPELAVALGSTPRGHDTIAGFNCHAIVLEIPTSALTGTGVAPVAGVSGTAATNNPQTLGVWASASRRKVRVLRSDGTSSWYGPWVQVSRLGLPLVNEAVIGIQDKDKYNRTKPATDLANFAPYFVSPTIVKNAVYVLGTADGISAAAGLAANETNRDKDLVPLFNLTNVPATASHNLANFGDVLHVDMGFDSGFPNGRVVGDGGKSGTATNTEADVTDIELSVLLLKGTSGISDGVNHNDTNYLTTFPYLADPWEGYGHSHFVSGL